MALTDNLVSYWKMDGNSTDSIGSNTGTDTSITYNSSNGKLVQGAGFTTASNIAKTTPVGLPSGNTDMTIGFWAYLTVNQDAGIPGCITWGTEANFQMAGFGIGPQGANGLYWLGYSNDTSETWSYSLNTWYYVLATYTSSSKTVQWYIDGVAKGSGHVLTSTPNVGTTFMRMGVQRPGNLVHHVGNLDEIGVWTRVITSAEITALYNNGVGNQYPFSPTITGITSITL